MRDFLPTLVLIYVHVCFYKTGIKILFYYTTRGLGRETMLRIIIAPVKDFKAGDINVAND